MASDQRSPALISEDTVKRMGDELVRLCDGIERHGIERHGLVDYQYGVWEEQIESGECRRGPRRQHGLGGHDGADDENQVLEECLDLFPSHKASGAGEDEAR